MQLHSEENKRTEIKLFDIKTVKFIYLKSCTKKKI
jgi:hypothetical protein